MLRNQKPITTLPVGRQQLHIQPSPTYCGLNGHMDFSRAGSAGRSTASSISLTPAGAEPLRTQLLPQTQLPNMRQPRCGPRPRRWSQLSTSLVFTHWSHGEASSQKGLPSWEGGHRIQLNPLTHPRGSKEGQQPPGAEPPF